MSFAVARQASPAMNGICYQIDFTAVAAGKRVATTKRRVRWRFGFVNKDALESGQTGTACRGEEHDITIVWSVTSGKRLILADGQEIHYSNNRTSVFEFSWTMRGNHVLKVIAHAAPAMTATPGFRQYDLFVDGQSFFHMPKVYELGILKGPREPPHAYANYALSDGGNGGYARSDALTGSAPTTEQEEDYDLQRAIRESLKESQRHLEKKQESAPTPVVQAREAPAVAPAPATQQVIPREPEVQDLLDFAAEPMPAPTPTGSFGANAGSGPTPYDPFTVQNSPSYSSVASDVLAAYNQPVGGAVSAAPAAPAPYNNYAPQPAQPQVANYDYQNGAPVQPVFSSPQQPPAYNGERQDYGSSPYSAVTDPTHDGTNATDGSPRHNLQVDTGFEGDQRQQETQPNGNNFETTFKNIVNLDDINSPASSPDSANPFENTFKDSKQKDKLKKGNAQAPAYGWGPQKTLAEMKAMQPGQGPPKTEVMRAPPMGVPGNQPPMNVPHQQPAPTPPGAPGAMVMFNGGQANPSGVNNWAGSVMSPPVGQMNGYPPMGGAPPQPNYGNTPTNGYMQQQQPQQWGGQPQYPPHGGAPPPQQQGYYQQQQYTAQY